MKEQLQNLRKKSPAEIAMDKAMEERGLKKGEKPKKKPKVKK